MRNRNKPVYFLNTFDVDPVSENEVAIRSLDPAMSSDDYLLESIQKATDLTEEIGIKSTFFVTAKNMRVISKEIINLRKLGHTIGCHGLTHGNEEEYDKMDLKQINAYIKKATNILEQSLNEKVRFFRGPRAKISTKTIAILEKLGYEIDSSIFSQRLDVFSSNLINYKWLFSPRLPYYPNPKNVFRRGSKRKIMEVPSSACVLPFISAVLSIGNVNLMKLLFNVLYSESVRTGKPIVYLSHPIEYCSNPEKGEKLSKKMLIPSSQWLITGIPLRWFFFCRDGNKFYEKTIELFDYIKTFNNVQFVNFDDYQKILLEKNNES